MPPKLKRILFMLALLAALALFFVVGTVVVAIAVGIAAVVYILGMLQKPADSDHTIIDADYEIIDEQDKIEKD